VLPEPARRWVCDVTGMTLVEAADLPGATSSRVYLLRFDDDTRLVLRLHTNDDWLSREPDLATREAHTLKALGSSAVVAPAPDRGRRSRRVLRASSDPNEPSDGTRRLL